MAGWLDGVDSIVREDAGDPDVWLHRITDHGGESTFVVWHHRDAFHGEDEPAVPVTFPVPWAAITAEDVFGDAPAAILDNGSVTVDIIGTPVRVSSADR